MKSLAIKDVYKSDAERVEFDAYIPFTLSFIDEGCDTPLYWRAGHDSSSLVEIGINDETGSIESVTLTAINSDHVSEEIENSVVESPNIEQGVPLCNLDPWLKRGISNFDDRFIDSEKQISIGIGSKQVTLIIDKNKEAVRFVYCSRCYFGISSDDSIISVTIIELESSELAVLKESIS